VPMAMLATLLKHMWGSFFELALLTLATFGSRVVGYVCVGFEPSAEANPNHAQEAMPTQAPAPESLRGVKGWLLLFCILRTILEPLGFISLLAFSVGKGIAPGRFVEVAVPGCALCALSIYVGVCLWRVTANALRWLKVFFIAVGSLSALALLGDIVARSDPHKEAEGLFWIATWYLYFHKSERVRLTYGRNL